jgi:hypothetical protein
VLLRSFQSLVRILIGDVLKILVSKLVLILCLEGLLDSFIVERMQGVLMYLKHGRDAANYR